MNEATASARLPERHARWTLSARGRRELVIFGAVYAIYLAGRWLSAGDLGVAREHARWILSIESSLHIAIEGSVQRALEAEAVIWLLASRRLSR